MFGKGKKDGVKVLEDYKVGYLGGDARYPKAKKTGLDFKLYEDALRIEKVKWFDGLEIPYTQIRDIIISDRQLSGLDIVATGLLSSTLKQANNINVAYVDEEGNERIIRFEMFSGGTVWGTAKKCKEMLDRLVHHQLRKQFMGTEEIIKGNETVQESPMEKIEKLAELKEKGILTEEEFTSKKKELLEMM